MSQWFGNGPKLGLEVSEEKGRQPTGEGQANQACPLPPLYIPTASPHPQTGSSLVTVTQANTRRLLPLWELSRADEPHLSRRKGERAVPPRTNPMESASPALSIRAAASRNKQNKHPRLGQAGKACLTHSFELHPLPWCFVWSIETIGVGARPCLTTVLLPQLSPRLLISAMGVCFFISGLGEGGWMGMADQ